MPTYKIRGIDVDFPYEAYDCQVVYMERVIRSLQEGCNALLESPTGTGKTLCLLCATLAWRKTLGEFSTGPKLEKPRYSASQHSGSQSTESSRPDQPIIIYASRTHSQLKQVIRELRASSYSNLLADLGGQTALDMMNFYRPVKHLLADLGGQTALDMMNFYRIHVLSSKWLHFLGLLNFECLRCIINFIRPRMGVLGSREQMCIHDEVRLLQGRMQNNACRNLCKKRLCRHHSRVSEYMQSHHELGNTPIDIEDLVNLGRNKGLCPYYLSRELHKDVDILFAPYNYLIDPGNRRSLTGINWKDAVLIFDEAHNLESVCADAASFDLPSTSLTACISEADQCVVLCAKRKVIEKSTDKHLDPENYSLLGALLKKLKDELDEVPIESKELGYTRPGDYIFEFLSKLNITFETANMLIDTIENAALLLEEGNATANGISVKTKGTICRLESLKDILQVIFRDGGKGHAKYYRETQSSFNDPSKGKLSKKPRTLSWWCFNPGLAMEEFIRLGVGSIILTSGTLSPLDSFALELNLEFPVRLENPHVVSPFQVWVGVVSTGPSGFSLNSSYRTRDSVEYKQELGNAIVNFARIVPDGLLVFFPSYYLMERCIDCWKNMSHASSKEFCTIWERICKNKQPVMEPRQSALFSHAIQDFEAKLRDNTTSGAVFFAVCRGKVSEGLDFADRSGRAVVIIGMPFSMKTDPKVRLKRDYLDKQALARQRDSKVMQTGERELKVLTGEEWYVQQAARAVNQAVGRVIRHHRDYGAIIFCDERFAHQNYQSQMSYWLRPYVKYYPKFGDIVFTLTKFFRDNGASAQLKPEIEESIALDIADKPQDKILSSKGFISQSSTAEHISGEPSLSVISNTRGKPFDQLKHIIPANRATLFNKMKGHMSSQQSSDLVFFSNRLKTNGSSIREAHHQDDKVVDLTSDAFYPEQLETEDAMEHYPAKKPKVLEMVCKAANLEHGAPLERLCDVDVQHLPLNSCSSGSLDTPCKKILQLPSYEPLKVGSSNKARVQDVNTSPVRIVGRVVSIEKSALKQQHHNKEDARSTSAYHGEEEKTRGSAFLMQVQQKLAVEEYKEFVGLMQAMKSKMMKVTPVLESIARLFCSPGRFSLLKRFGDFVPAKYRPIYEQHLQAHVGEETTAFDSEAAV